MQGRYKPLLRAIENRLSEAFAKDRSVLLLGPRQVGKTTLIQKLLTGIKEKQEYYFQDPTTRLSLEADPGRLIRQVEASSQGLVVFVDEAQKVPEIFDAAQYLIDSRKATFIFSGSSARKLRRKNVNLLPGRIQKYSLDPLLWCELGFSGPNHRIPELTLDKINKQGGYSFEDSLVYGSLPAIIYLSEDDRAEYLRSYSHVYLEEEIRAEALTRKIGGFSRFLELAAAESGTSPNLTKLSQESGVSVPTIKEFYSVLEDTLVVERVDPFLRSPRKRILSSSRYYFFDLGVRNALARLPLTGALINAQKGQLFEHAVILEIRRRLRALGKDYRTYFWRTSGGAEVDCVIDIGKEIIPIEIKSTQQSVVKSELRGLESFIATHKNQVKRAFVVAQVKRAEKLSDIITMIPWREL